MTLALLFYAALLFLSALFETFFAAKGLLTPESLVAAENLRALWWLNAYCVAILALSLLSIAGWHMRHDTRAARWIAVILTFFHSAQFSGVAAKDIAAGVITPGWVHGLVALMGLCFLALSFFRKPA